MITYGSNEPKIIHITLVTNNISHYMLSWIHTAHRDDQFVQRLTILDSPVSCIYCRKPGEEQASVGNAQCWGVMIWAASRRARTALCASVCPHHLHTLWIGSKMCVMSCACLMNMHKAMFCLQFQSIWALAAVLFLSLSVSPNLEYFLHLWPLLNKPKLICFNVLKETGKWIRETQKLLRRKIRLHWVREGRKLN